MEKQIISWAWASGLIEFGDVLPDGALPILEGDEKAVRELVEVRARISYSNEPLVPGIPEATTQDEAYDALIRFTRMVEQDYHSYLRRLGHENQ